MKTTLNKSIKHSLLIEEEELTSLCNFIRSRFSKIEIVAECNDGSQLDTEDITEIINFENLNYRRIKVININAHNSFEETLRLRIGSGWLFDTAHFTINSKNDESAVYMSQELTKRLADMKPGYDLLARISLTLTVAVVWGTYGLIRTIPLVPLSVKPGPPTSQLSPIQELNVLILIVITFFAILYPFDLLRKTLSPIVFFMIGKQKKRMETLKKWRMIIFSGLILSILGSLIAAFIYSRF